MNHKEKSILYDDLKKTLSVIGRISSAEEGDNFHKSNDTLCAIYDLRIAPPTYDFLNSLTLVKSKEKRKA